MDYELFVRTYQSCDDDIEVAEKLNISVGYVTSLASKLRKRGIPLKYRRSNYKRFDPANVEHLKRVALNQGEGEGYDSTNS